MWNSARFATVLLSAVVVLSLVLRVRRRTGNEGCNKSTKERPKPPEQLVRALLDGICVAVVGDRFCVTAVSRVLPRADSLLRTVQSITQNQAASGNTGAQFSQRLSSDLTVEELDELQFEIVDHYGRAPVASSLVANLRKRGPLSAEINSRLRSLGAIPFAAVLALGWDDLLERIFPRGVGRNFGGYSAVMARPNIDSLTARTPPLLRLDGSLNDPDSLVLSREDRDRVFNLHGSHLTFLQDVLRSKVVLFVGLEGPPLGCLGEVLQQLCSFVRGGRPTLDKPIAYIIAADTSPAQRDEWFRKYGLEVFEGRDVECIDALAALIKH